RTAGRYIWLADNKPDIEKAARAKGYDWLSLGVNGATKLLAEYKDEQKLAKMSPAERKLEEAKAATKKLEDDAAEEKAQKEADEATAKEYLNAHPELKSIPTSTDLPTLLKDVPVNDMFQALTEIYDADALDALTDLIDKHVGGDEDQDEDSQEDAD